MMKLYTHPARKSEQVFHSSIDFMDSRIILMHGPALGYSKLEVYRLDDVRQILYSLEIVPK